MYTAKLFDAADAGSIVYSEPFMLHGRESLGITVVATGETVDATVGLQVDQNDDDWGPVPVGGEDWSLVLSAAGVKNEALSPMPFRRVRLSLSGSSGSVSATVTAA